MAKRRKSNSARRYTALTAIWNRKTPTQLQFRDPGRPKSVLGTRQLSRSDAQILSDSTRISISNPTLNFYDPRCDLTPKAPDRRIRRHRLAWPNEKSILGNLELWGPAIPGDNASQPEPRDILFSGESGFLVVHVKNRGDAPVTILSASVQTGRTRAIQGRTKSRVAIPSRAAATYSIPITVAEKAEAAFAPVKLLLSCIVDGRRVALRHSVHVSVGHLVKFDQQLRSTKDPETKELALSMTAETPGGFREAVAATIRVRSRVSRSGAVTIHMTPLSYKASVFLPVGFATTTASLPPNLYLTFSFSGIFSEIARRVFQVATAAIMACLATAGVAATKFLIAVAANALGPAVGVPVALVLSTPLIEAWFAKAAIVIFGTSGWVLNGELYDEIFG